MAYLESYLELMGLKSREEVGSGRNISPLERMPKFTQQGCVPEEVLLVMRFC
jgi:hypothetical protein